THRNLHSIPTRRSSDLTPIRKENCARALRIRGDINLSIRSEGRAQRDVPGFLSAGGLLGPQHREIELERLQNERRPRNAGARGRSEEHTSELQSQSNLV